MDHSITGLIGDNGSGKTALLHALLRMFGITAEERQVTRKDFHVPVADLADVKNRTFEIEVILVFPELESADPQNHKDVPGFFRYLVADGDGTCRCRLLLQAEWADEGSLDGSISSRLYAVTTLEGEYEGKLVDVRNADRGHVQMVYIPAKRDGVSKVTGFLRSRFWRAAQWSNAMHESLATSGEELEKAFRAEGAVGVMETELTKRWGALHAGGTDARPEFRLLERDLSKVVRNVNVTFTLGPDGRDTPAEELSDGQRSLLHLAMTAATLQVEATIKRGGNASAFNRDDLALPALTLIGIEEPENNLSPFYLSRIMSQVSEHVSCACSSFL